VKRHTYHEFGERKWSGFVKKSEHSANCFIDHERRRCGNWRKPDASEPCERQMEEARWLVEVDPAQDAEH
jgi:hypothetical protein